MNNDLISREALKKLAIPCEIHNGALTEMCVPLYQIDNAPAVVVGYLTNCANCERVEKIRAKRQQGEWKKYASFTEGGELVNITYKCSNCGRKIAYIVPSNKPFKFEMFLKEYPFCNCGADMRGAQNE